MNRIIHDITYACPNAAASPVRGSIYLACPDLGWFWGGVSPPGYLFPVCFLFLPLFDIICLLNIGSIDIVGPVALSCVHLYGPTMSIVVVAVVVVAVLVNVVAVVVLGAGRPHHLPLPPFHPPNGENMKAWV